MLEGGTLLGAAQDKLNSGFTLISCVGFRLISKGTSQTWGRRLLKGIWRGGGVVQTSELRSRAAFAAGRRFALQSRTCCIA
eukprot:s999_g3.t2